MTKRSYVEAVLRGALLARVRGATAAAALTAPAAGIDSAPCGAGGGDGSGAITVRLILSIDRREGACCCLPRSSALAVQRVPSLSACCCRADCAAALETVALAAELRGRGVVGVDLSGNPTLGTFATWQPALQAARAAGLPLTLHCGEVDNADEARTLIRGNSSHALYSASPC
jgi:adenosine deaminase